MISLGDFFKVLDCNESVTIHILDGGTIYCCTWDNLPEDINVLDYLICSISSDSRGITLEVQKF